MDRPHYDGVRAAAGGLVLLLALAGWSGISSHYARPDRSDAVAGATLSVSPTTAQESAAALGDTLEADSLPGDTLEADALGRDTVSGGATGVGAVLAEIASFLSRLLFYTGIMGLIGTLAFRALVLSPLGRAGEFSDVLTPALGRTWQMAMTSVAAALLAVPVRLWVQVYTYFPDDPLGNLGTATTQAGWGGGWWLHAGSAMLALGGLVLARPLGQRTIGWVVAAVGILLLPLAAAISGHAWANEPRALAVISLYLHIVAASTWVGGLCCLIRAGLPAILAREGPTSDGYVFPGTFHGLPATVGAFSRIAMAAVALLVVTGTTSAWLHLDAFSQLWITPWGRTLLIKTAFSVATMGLCFYNWRVVRPALAGSRRMALLKGPVTMEFALGGGVVVATSWLVVRSLG